VADTSQNWNKETALRNLLIHDLKYQGGSVCIDTYNDFRDSGYTVDPIAIYRLKLFFSHPFQAWKFRDIPGMLCFIASIILLLILPFIWILPVYFIGHKWGWISRKKFYESIWGLKIFWIVSFGYLIASFLSVAAQPEYFYSLFNSYEDLELSENKKGFMSLLFTLIFAVFSLASLYKIKGSVLLSMNWPIRKSIFLSIGVLLAFKLITGVYIGIGLSKWGITADDLTGITNLLMSTRQDIEALMNTYGKGTGFVLICLLVPFYEEIVFRGVILDSCQRYINFNVANLIQSTLFATVHMSLFLFPVFFIFGIVTGIMRKKSGGLLAGFVFHIVNNVLAISLILIRSQN
jgi:membrane protease YdiL (CAAX protease family)